ncbi:hypothetical protein LTR94_030825 [Friedmanniomyces endolithicus]|nr:hypothetical protein LTR94_030825 [Friedmanniomyces endolithicus]
MVKKKRRIRFGSARSRIIENEAKAKIGRAGPGESPSAGKERRAADSVPGPALREQPQTRGVGLEGLNRNKEALR